MKLDRLLRLLGALLVALISVAIVAAVLFLTESALNISARLSDYPPLLRYGYWFGIGAVLLGFVAMGLRLLWPRRQGIKESPIGPVDEQSLRSDIRAAAETGVDVSEARAELERLDEMRAAGQLRVALFGEASTGKTTLLRALVPEAETQSDVLAGTTRHATTYEWRTPGGDQISLTDLPGTGAGVDELAVEEALRAHLVVFVCEGDLTQSESDGLRKILALDKPTIVAINKTDRYDNEELDLLRERVETRLTELGQADPMVVATVTGGEEQIIVETESGESTEVRERPPSLWQLTETLDRVLESDVGAIQRLRDRSVFSLAQQKLLNAQKRYRQSESVAIIRSYTRKAVLGALAAVSPGTDILIQGYLGTAMVRALCRLYGVAPRDVDVEEFLDLSQGKLGQATPIALAVAGNALKAFPGVGTVAGGAVHAVAYGLIFDALGRGLTSALEQTGTLSPESAAEHFQETLDIDLQGPATELAKVALGFGERNKQ